MRWRLALCFALAGCGGEAVTGTQETSPGDTSTNPPAPPAPPPTSQTKSDPLPSTATLRDNRDRLIDTLAVRKSSTRCPLWTSLTATQKGVFLTITDLLGKRSFLTNDPAGGAPRSGVDLETALDHVTKVYEIRDSNGSNGGGDNNRIFVQADAKLIAALRDFDGGLPEWAKSSDLAGAHAPFDGTSETVTGQPRGQSHFWSSNASAKPLGRPGVEDVNDPHVVEIDIDYDFLHNSNPEGTYFPNGKGRDHYAKVWTPKPTGMAAGGPEYDYVPTGCP
jgi:hypothetical protein